MDPFIVGVDTSEASAHALRVAAHLASASGSPLVVIFVKTYQAEAWSPELGARYDLDRFNDEKEKVARHMASEILEPTGVTYSLETVAGDPADEIIAAADRLNAAMIVVGSRGFGAVKRMLLGSVSTRLVHHATRPVLVVPDEAEPESAS